MKEILKPTPVSVTTPTMMPTVAAAAPTPIAYFAPTTKASTMSITRALPRLARRATPDRSAPAMTAKTGPMKTRCVSTPGRDGADEGGKEPERHEREPRTTPTTNAGGDAPERGEIGREAGEQHDEQDGKRHDRLPALADDPDRIGQLLGRQAAHAPSAWPRNGPA